MNLQRLEAVIRAMKDLPEIEDSTADISIGESATYFEVDADLFKEAIGLLESHKQLIQLSENVLEKYDQMMNQLETKLIEISEDILKEL